MARAKFISIEGTEGAGKSTALLFIREYLKKAKIDTVWTREPGGTEIAEDIRAVLLKRGYQEEMAPLTELLLMFAGRAQHIEKFIMPALNAGKWVVTDRFIDASYAYQGGGRGISREDIDKLDKLVVAGRYPDLTILMDISPELGFLRTEKRGAEKDRIETEKIDFFTRVRDAYLLRAKQDPARIKVIDAGVELFAVENQIRGILDEFIARNA